MTGRVVIAGSVAQKPGNAGHTWQFLQYLLGFRRLGWDVLLLDSLAGAPGDVTYVEEVMDRFGMDGAWSIDLGDGEHAGVDRQTAIARVREADLLINVMGFLSDEELLGAARKRVFLDTDPGFGQMWQDLGLADIFAGHDAHVTIGERIGEPDCTIPTCGLEWITTPQPVVLDAWPSVSTPPRRPFTSVASWRGAYGPIEHGGHTYGLRVHEFRRFADLPVATGLPFELALSIHPDETADLELLDTSGWTLIEPRDVAATPERYRQFIAESEAELMIAKGLYVDSRGGWFSERSMCYLASGRPVLAQDTGLADRYPVGCGLVTFSTPEEAVAGLHELRADPQRHATGARELAEAYFDSDKVLTRLLERL